MEAAVLKDPLVDLVRKAAMLQAAHVGPCLVMELETPVVVARGETLIRFMVCRYHASSSISS